MEMLFFEKFIKSAASTRGRGGRASGIARFAFNGCSSHEKCTFVADIFFDNSLWNRLRAFKLSAGIKVPAVLAGPQICTTFRTLTAFGNFQRIGNDGPAHRASQ